MHHFDRLGMMLLLFVSMSIPAVLSSLASGDVSGDALEHFNLYPLTREITLDQHPVQAIHIALYGATQVRITWLNPVQFQLANFTFKPECHYGLSPGNLIYSVQGYPYSYEAGLFRLTLNTAVLDLAVLPYIYTTIYYLCGDPGYGFSSVYFFTKQLPTIVNPDRLTGREDDKVGLGIKDSLHVPKDKHDYHSGVINMEQAYVDKDSHQAVPSKKIVLIADMGVTHATNTMSGIQHYVVSGIAQLVVHAGDISYADNFSPERHNNSYIWVEYMNQLNGINPWVPYMTCPGNHEAQYNFSAYLNWLPMPHQQSASLSHFWYSFDYMGVHFLSFSTEHPFHNNTDQFRFMQQDLMKANENRASVPWIIIFGHRPLYCTSEFAKDRCLKEAVLYRSYLEDLFHEQKVDIYLCGHNHNYERTYPVYRGHATQKHFHNPTAPVYIVDGAAGNPEPNDPSYMPGIDWRAYVYASIDNGFLLVEPTANQLRFEYVRSHDRKIIDTFTISRS